jgi:predicted  nucleic acid-binding Zn-ribbon protein
VSEIDRLLAVQDLDCRLRDLRREMADIPARQQEERSRLAEHEANVAEAEQALKAEQANIKQLEVEIESRREKIAKLRQQQMQLKSNDEFRAMEHQIASVGKEIGELEDSELVLMESVEGARGVVAERRRELGAEAAAVEEDVDLLNQRLAAIREEAAGLEQQRAGAVDGIDAEWLTRYERILERRDRAIVALEGGVCGGCHMKLPPSVLQNVKRSEGMVACEHCGRLLYSC